MCLENTPLVGTLEDADEGYGPSDTGAPGISKKGKFHYEFMFKCSPKPLKLLIIDVCTMTTHVFTNN